eukprot:CAMPEP_0196573074 /NCGR_PEP_ID=MMETSP1081-20130531/3031_1 /TAXON_ID=36882 /ORGANISM="Pyramimonas amylifera, Strain CCMP720" /LENGTH=927 /DNA_ID=CAMNT_0041890645 /DNA_START=52 /DNA_END=2835 /DNA_ORIENTATION=-
MDSLPSTAPIGRQIVQDLMKEYKKSRLKEVVKEITSGKESDDREVKTAKRSLGRWCGSFCLLVLVLLVFSVVIAAHIHAENPSDPAHKKISAILEKWSAEARSSRVAFTLFPVTAPNVVNETNNEDVSKDTTSSQSHIEIEDNDGEVEEGNTNMSKIGNSNETEPNVESEFVDDASNHVSENGTEGPNSLSNTSKEEREEEAVLNAEDEAKHRFEKLLSTFRPNEEKEGYLAEVAAMNKSAYLEEKRAQNITLPPPPKHTKLIAPMQCVLSNTQGVRRGDNALVGSPLAEGDSKILRLMRDNDDLSELDRTCQFLTKECVEQAEKERFYDDMQSKTLNLKMQGEQLRAAVEAQEKESEEQLSLARDQDRHNKKVLQHYFEVWVPEQEQVYMDLVDDFERRVMKPAQQMKVAQKSQGRAKKGGAAVGVDGEVSGWAVAKSYHLLYDADPEHPVDRRDPYSRAHDLSFRRDGTKQVLGMAEQALKAAQGLGQVHLEEKLQKKVRRLSSVLLAMRTAYKAAQKSADMLRAHLDQIGGMDINQTWLDPDPLPNAVTSDEGSGNVSFALYPPGFVLRSSPPKAPVILFIGASEAADKALADEYNAAISIQTSPPPPPPFPPPASVSQAQTSRRAERISLAQSNQTGHLPRVPQSTTQGFLGRCAYVPKIDQNAAQEYKNTITDHDTLVVCDRNFEVKRSLRPDGWTTLGPKASKGTQASFKALDEELTEKTCTFVSLAHQRITPHDPQDAIATEDLGVEHTSSFTVSVEGLSSRLAHEAITQAHQALAADHSLEKMLKRQKPGTLWNYHGEVSPSFVSFVAVLRSKWCSRMDVFGQPSSAFSPKEIKRKTNESNRRDPRKEERGKKKKGWFGRRLMSASKKQKKIREDMEEENRMKLEITKHDDAARKEQEWYMLLIAQHAGDLCLYSQNMS